MSEWTLNFRHRLGAFDQADLEFLPSLLCAFLRARRTTRAAAATSVMSSSWDKVSARPLSFLSFLFAEDAPGRTWRYKAESAAAKGKGQLLKLNFLVQHSLSARSTSTRSSRPPSIKMGRCKTSVARFRLA